jgi:hypothetical protein
VSRKSKRAAGFSPRGSAWSVGFALLNAFSSVLAAAPDLPPEGREWLAAVQDNVFGFDEPAFYWLCRHVREQEADRYLTVAALNDAEVTPWRAMIERPSDYRGRIVVVEGILRTRTAYIVDGPGREDIGELHQSELADPTTRGFCTLVTIETPADIPIGSRVRARGYFLKVRAYQDTAGREGFAPLIVAPALTLVSLPVAIGKVMARDRWRLFNFSNPATLAAWLVALGCVLLIVRGYLRVTRKYPVESARPSTEDDFDWMDDLSR